MQHWAKSRARRGNCSGEGKTQATSADEFAQRRDISYKVSNLGPCKECTGEWHYNCRSCPSNYAFVEVYPSKGVGVCPLYDKVPLRNSACATVCAPETTTAADNTVACSRWCDKEVALWDPTKKTVVTAECRLYKHLKCMKADCEGNSFLEFLAQGKPNTAFGKKFIEAKGKLNTGVKNKAAAYCKRELVTNTTSASKPSICFVKKWTKPLRGEDKHCVNALRSL